MVCGRQAPAEENEASPRDNDECINDDVFHVSIVPSERAYVKPYFGSLKKGDWARQPREYR